MIAIGIGCGRFQHDRLERAISDFSLAVDRGFLQIGGRQITL